MSHLLVLSQVFLWSCVSIGVAGSVLVLIVWPKVNRVRSGEKVVVSGLLGSRYSMKIPSATESRYESDRSMMESAPDLGKRERIQVNEDDPVPPGIETKILDMQGLFRRVTNQW